MDARAHDALAELRVETGEVAHFRGTMIARNESEERSRAEEYAQRGGDVAMRREWDDQRFRIAVARTY